MTRYIVTSNALYGEDIAELIKLGLASKMNLTQEQLYWRMYNDCYLMADKFDGITISYDEVEKSYFAQSGHVYYGTGKTEIEALQDYLRDKDDFSS